MPRAWQATSSTPVRAPTRNTERTKAAGGRVMGWACPMSNPLEQKSGPGFRADTTAGGRLPSSDVSERLLLLHLLQHLAALSSAPHHFTSLCAGGTGDSKEPARCSLPLLPAAQSCRGSSLLDRAHQQHLRGEGFCEGHFREPWTQHSTNLSLHTSCSPSKWQQIHLSTPPSCCHSALS